MVQTLFPTGAHALLPDPDRAFRWERRTLPEGGEVLAIAQRVRLGRVDTAVMSRLQSDFLATISAYGNRRGMQLAGEPSWIEREEKIEQSHHTRLDYETMQTTPHFFVAPIEVFGFVLPEKRDAQGRVRAWLRPLFRVVSGRELYAQSWLTAQHEQVLFTHGYAFLDGKLRPNPYPYGPGAFDGGIKQFEFVRMKDDTVEARMLGVMAPSVSRRMSQRMGGSSRLWRWLDGISLAHHARIHAQMFHNLC